MAVLTAAFMLDLLNATIVTVALPAVQRGLTASPTQVEWFSAAYLLAFAAALITAARLGDLCGRKRVFLVGTAVLGLAALAAGLAPDPTALIAARAVQGLGAALIAPQVISILHGIFHGRERATVFGVFGIAGPFAQSAGLVLGGGLVTADLGALGWRSVFLVSVPVTAVLVVLGSWLVPESRVADAVRPRWLAAGTLTAGLVAIVFPLLEGRAYGWPAWTWACLAAGVLAVVGLAAAEHRRPSWRAGALLPLGLLRRRNIVAGLAVMLLSFAGFNGFLLVFSLWLQDGQGHGPLAAGLITIVFCAGSLVTAIVVGRLTTRFGRGTVLVGCLLVAVGTLGLLGPAQAEGAAGVWSLVPGLLVAGAGINLVFPALATLYLSAAPPEFAGSASGIYNTAQQFGASVGVAVLGAVFFAGVDASGYASAFTVSVLTVAAALVVSALLSLTLTPHRRGAATGPA
ncbi:MFS transporter [Goodfellowiella coeruleoviolacea]|nr:MFS transporter [Goodfellowiella coeruleoviolacea]